ncbi:ElyC/SanA/YdcF family protein [Dietzia sp. PP-33]|uniref:ElyC/SanA/YdcF family protein n=1 Tax=Dietzia sp. PP-33 TaxID=2957500 RepID=UPI0029A37699|nr:ElyC/SanA/YdcF family protein [Dietzia sp. PP-33]MDX2358781.1 YdcF family protein [Dietzia sp. PP-33]
MKRRPNRRSGALVVTTLFVLVAAMVGLTAGSAVLHPRVDSPDRVDAIVVVAGALDDRYVYARHLAEDGVADRILVSQPPSGSGTYEAYLNSFCASTPVTARDGRRIEIHCFAPDLDTTEGETTAATRIARERGWGSLLVVTYWGHVSRVRIYFEQCFDGTVYVTDTPRPLSKSRKDALLHETGGYLKAFLTPAC